MQYLHHSHKGQGGEDGGLLTPSLHSSAGEEGDGLPSQGSGEPVRPSRVLMEGGMRKRQARCEAGG